MAFLLSKCSAIEETAVNPRKLYVCDYALLAEYAYADMHLGEHDKDAHSIAVDTIDLMRERLGDPSLLVYLECPAAEQLKRIKTRMESDDDRDFEEIVTADYLSRLNQKIEERVAIYEKTAPVLRLDSAALDFSQPETADAVYRKIERAFVTIQKPQPLSSPPSSPSL